MWLCNRPLLIDLSETRPRPYSYQRELSQLLEKQLLQAEQLIESYQWRASTLDKEELLCEQSKYRALIEVRTYCKCVCVYCGAGRAWFLSVYRA